MRRFLIAASLAVFLGLGGFAQTSADQPASKQDVERYLNAVHSHEMIRQTVAAMSKPIHQMMHEQYEKEKDKLPADFEARMDKIMDDYMKELPLDGMMDAMVPAYQKHFTKGDIDALTAFYSAPTGQKILRELPVIMAEAMETVMPMMRNSIDRMTERLQDQIAEMKKQQAGPAGETTKN